MQRRDFISDAGIFSMTLLFPFGKLFGKSSLDSANTKIWLRLLEYAKWSPSPHNVQPWKLKIISATEAHLFYDPQRVPFVVDPSTGFTIATMGMFIECMNIAAGFEGFKVVAEHESETKMNNTTKEPSLFAKLYLVATNEKPYADRELIKKRRTSRLHYDGGILDPVLVKDLEYITSIHGHTLHYSSDKELIDYTIDLNSKAILFESNDKPAMEEMCKWMRYNDKEAAEKKDGLSASCMCTPGRLLRSFFLKHDSFNRKWKQNMTHRMLNKGMQGTSNIAWISGDFENRNDWVKAGIMLQRLWLEMTKRNVYLHPMGTIITTPSQHEIFRQHINFDESNGKIWLLVRLGYSKEPPRSYRLDTKNLLIA